MSKINIIHKKLHEEGEGLHFVNNETVQDGIVKETYEIGLPSWLNNQAGLYNTIGVMALDTIHSKSLSNKDNIENNKNYFILASALTDYVTDKINNIENTGSSITIAEQVEKDNNNAVSSGGVYNAIASHIENGHHWNTVTGKHYRLDPNTDLPNGSAIHPSGEYIVLYYSDIAANTVGVAMAADTYNYISSAIFDKTADSIDDDTSGTDFVSVDAVKDYVNTQVNITKLFFPELSEEERANYIIWSGGNPTYISFADEIIRGNGFFASNSHISSFTIDLPNLETSDYMFYHCYNLSYFNSCLKKLKNGEGMFTRCKLNKKSLYNIIREIENNIDETPGDGYIDIKLDTNLYFDKNFIADLENNYNLDTNGNIILNNLTGKKWILRITFN